MAATGYVTPTATHAYSGVVNPDNGWTDNGSFATSSTANHYVRYDGFSFSIPAGRIILGVQVKLNGKESATGDDWEWVVNVSGDHAAGWGSAKTSAEPTATDADLAVLGATNDLWSEGFLANNIDTNFVVEVKWGTPAANAGALSLDAVSVQITYSDTGTTTSTSTTSTSSSTSTTSTSSSSTSTTSTSSSTSLTTTSSSTSTTFPPTQQYTMGDETSLPSTDTNLEHSYTEQEYLDVASDNTIRVPFTGNGIVLHEFKDKNTNNTDRISISWNGQSTVAPSVQAVTLQIYDQEGGSWEDVDVDNETAANTDFTLSGTITSDLDHYYVAGTYWVSCRVYQSGV